MGLARGGAKLAVCARTEATLHAMAEEIRRATGVEVLAQPVDVTDYEQVRSFVGETVKRFGRVDICVTNAGGPPAKPFADTSVEDWQAAVNLNLMSTLYFARELLPLMQKQKWGRFITITSVAVKQPVEGLILSNAVCSTVSGLVKSLANEYGKDNVLVNNVCPGYTQTAGLDELAAKLAAAQGVEPEQVRALGRPGSTTALGPAGRVRQSGDLPGLRVCQLHHRRLHRCGRRVGEGDLLGGGGLCSSVGGLRTEREREGKSVPDQPVQSSSINTNSSRGAPQPGHLVGGSLATSA